MISSSRILACEDMVSQAILYAAHVLPVGMIWLACVTGFLPLMKLGPDCDCFRHLVLYVYAIASVVHGVLTFNDCPAAKEELLQEIKEAREDLKKRKVL
ncbi:hypothetical protein Y032_0614g683 [Ancylostoma ceylanicum]|uniref:Dolichol-phosphate mannosyltransferase subunit 3 n=1 Tax=Ancylostoma ceylanicum TaxID=53326 RepID=A0A016WMX8_9BILA|nr:hypothetical protein Y032_0614g683 [Ancylostoma ceylanicum]